MNCLVCFWRTGGLLSWHHAQTYWEAQKASSHVHARTRARIQMIFGLLKVSFHCLHHLRVSPLTSCDFTVITFSVQPCWPYSIQTFKCVSHALISFLLSCRVTVWLKFWMSWWSTCFYISLSNKLTSLSSLMYKNMKYIVKRKLNYPSKNNATIERVKEIKFVGLMIHKKC